MSLPRDYFDEMYRDNPDPWQFRTRAYEARKRKLTVAVLPDANYGSVFEPGCSIGLLTAQLAQRCARVLSMDISPEALQVAWSELPPHVMLREGTLPADWPEERFDLVVFSEVGYYLNAEECRRMADLACESTRDMVAVHWRHRIEDCTLTGDEVHRILDDAAAAHNFAPLVRHLEADFRIDVWSSDHRSVAERTGLRDDAADPDSPE